MFLAEILSHKSYLLRCELELLRNKVFAESIHLKVTLALLYNEEKLWKKQFRWEILTTHFAQYVSKVRTDGFAGPTDIFEGYFMVITSLHLCGDVILELWLLLQKLWELICFEYEVNHYSYVLLREICTKRIF